MVGKLIVIEGMDGTGTTTQVKLLATHFRALSLKVINSAEPTNAAIGQEIRRLLALPTDKSPELLVSLALCFAADRMQHIHNTVAPGLKENDFVVLDRYVLSSLVYQGLHLPTSFVKEINKFALKPDITLVLDLDAKEAFKRLSSRASPPDFYETPKFLEKIRARYRHFLEEEPQKKVLIDAHGSIEQVESHIWHVVTGKFLAPK